MLQLSLAPEYTDAGAAPYVVQGDPAAALVAQVNRFAGKSVSLGCKARPYVPRAVPAAVLTDDAMFSAALIVNDFYNCACTAMGASCPDFGQQKARWANNGFTNYQTFVPANLNEITLALAQIADSKGYAPAAVGITAVDPKLKPTSKAPWYVAGGLAIAALGVVFTRRMK